MDARRNGTSAARDAVRKCSLCPLSIVSNARHNSRAINNPSLHISRLCVTSRAKILIENLTKKSNRDEKDEEKSSHSQIAFKIINCSNIESFSQIFF